MKSKLFLSLAFIVCVFISKAQQTLDNSFANNGILIENNISSLSQFALQSNGKIVVAGFQGKTKNNIIGFLIARYNTDGSLDNSFGRNGYAGDNGKADQIFDLAVEADDAIIAVGRTTNDIKIKRFKKDGNLDTAFGRNGNVIFGFGKNAYTYEGDIVIQPDGKILICGYASISKQIQFGFVARFLTNGSLDSNFSYVGYTTWNNLVPQNDLAVTSLALQKNGEIIVCWHSGGSTLVYRYSTNGFRDDGFGLTGIAQFYYTNHVVYQFQPTKLVVQADDKIIGSGLATDQSGNKFLFTAGRLTAKGIADSYGNDGLAAVDFTGKVVNVSGGILQNDGKLIIAGTVKQQGNKAMPATTRLSADGIIDSGFGVNGRLITQTDQYTECHDILLQPDNKILLGADAGISSPHIFIARYNNNVNSNRNIAKQLQQNQKSGITIKISPNPAINSLFIEGLSSTQKTNITVVDFIGNIKLQVFAKASSYNMNVASLKAGNYLLKLETNNTVITKPFIKQ